MVILHAAVLALGLSTIVAATASVRSVSDPTVSEFPNNTDTRHLLPMDYHIWTFCGANLQGNDIWNAHYSHPDDCVKYCDPGRGCDAATWTNYNGGTCWFKQIKEYYYDKASPSVGAISFVRRDTDGIAAYLRYDADMPGNDIGNHPGTMMSCIDLCARNNYCFAYTWTDYQGGTCWLKSRIVPYVTKSGATSAFIPRQINPNSCLG